MEEARKKAEKIEGDIISLFKSIKEDEDASDTLYTEIYEVLVRAHYQNTLKTTTSHTREYLKQP